MLRSTFVYGTLSTVALTPPAAQSAPTPVPSPTDGEAVCLENAVIPYDRPLEMKQPALDGPPFALRRYRGYAVWINIFATWCEPCRDEAPDVVAVAESYYSRGLRTVGLFAEEDDDKVRAYRSKYGIRYPLIRDETGALARMLQGNDKNAGFPAHLFITGGGTLYCFQIGGYDRASLETMIAGLLKTTQSPLPPDPEATRTPVAASVLERQAWAV